MLIGFDLGTTNCKAFVFDDNGKILGSATDEYPIISTQPGYAEQDAELLWKISKSVIGQAIKKSGVSSVKALSISVQGDAVIPVARNFQPLCSAILGMDYRSLPQTQECLQIFGKDKLFQITGMPPHPINALTKILWIRENHPEIAEHTWKFMTYADFLMGKLGADPVIDYSMASRTMGFSLKEKDWSLDILEPLGLNVEQFSQPEPSGKVVGRLSSVLLEEFGLKGETLLVSGGHDQTCAGIGAGLIHEGIGVDSTGTAEALSTVFSNPLLNQRMLESYYPCYIHAKADQYFTFSLNHTGGVVYQWFRDQLAEWEKREASKSGVSAYEILNKKMPDYPTRLFIFPHFNGSGSPTCDLASKGTVFGLTLNTTKYELARAFLEGLTYELRLNLETMQEAGIEIGELIAVGGGAKSSRWLEIKADITNRPVKILCNSEAACMGAAMLAGIGSGVYSNFEEAAGACVKYAGVYEPTKSTAALYEERYRIYRDLYETVLKLNHTI